VHPLYGRYLQLLYQNIYQFEVSSRFRVCIAKIDHCQAYLSKETKYVRAKIVVYHSQLLRYQSRESRIVRPKVFHSVIDMGHFDEVANKAEEQSERMKGIAACSDQRGMQWCIRRWN